VRFSDLRPDRNRKVALWRGSAVSIEQAAAQQRCMEKVTCCSAAAVTSGLVMLGRRMGKTLGVGPDTSAADVLISLKKHLAASPCVTLARVSMLGAVTP
jgi:hypothetical protein